jgi:hypothetical protein
MKRVVTITITSPTDDAESSELGLLFQAEPPVAEGESSHADGIVKVFVAMLNQAGTVSMLPIENISPLTQ